jgi:hypothetical protein
VALRLAPATERAVRRGPPWARRAIAGVLGVVLLIGAYALGRAGAPVEPQAGLPSPEAAGEQGQDENAAPEGADPAPAGGQGQAAAVGPTRVVNDVPVGYAQTEQGAIAAATNYLRAIGDKRAFSREWRERTYRTLADPAVVDELITSVEASYERIDADLGLGDAAAYDGSLLAVTVPVGYRVDEFAPDRARVSVWAAGWLTRPNGQQLPLRAQTSTLDLVWVDGDWKLADVSGVQPLNPPGVAAPVTDEMLAQMRGYRAYEYVPQDPR